MFFARCVTPSSIVLLFCSREQICCVACVAARVYSLPPSLPLKRSLSSSAVPPRTPHARAPPPHLVVFGDVIGSVPGGGSRGACGSLGGHGGGIGALGGSSLARLGDRGRHRLVKNRSPVRRVEASCYVRGRGCVTPRLSRVFASAHTLARPPYPPKMARALTFFSFFPPGLHL